MSRRPRAPGLSVRAGDRLVGLLAVAAIVLLWLQPFVEGWPKLLLMCAVAGVWMWRSATRPCPRCGRPVHERKVAGFYVHGAGTPRHCPHCGHDLELPPDG